VTFTVRGRTTPTPNRAPQASIGTDGATVDGGARVALAASASDPDGDALTYRWSGQGTFADAGSLSTTWTAPPAMDQDRAYTLTLTVSDSRLSVQASVDFTVRGQLLPARPVIASGAPGAQRGVIVLDWGEVEHAAGYAVLHLRNGHYVELKAPAEVSVDFAGSSAVVLGLDPDAAAVHSFRVRAFNGRGSVLSDTYAVDLRPAPQNLAGEYRDGEYGRLFLAWDAVANPGADYAVEQHFPDPGRPPGVWRALPHGGVTATVSTLADGRRQAVVGPLAPGGEYRHRVRATSAQGTSGPSGEVLTTVGDERPPVPTGIKAEYLVGYRGVELSWDDSAEASSFVVETRPTDGHVRISSVNTGAGRLAVQITGLDVIDYRLSVAARNDAGLSPPAWMDLPGRAPSYLHGHQADHTVRYDASAVDGTVIGGAVDLAARAWNLKMNYGLRICDDDAISCDGRNTDGGTVTVRAVAVDPDDLRSACARNYACVTGFTLREPRHDIGGRHLHDMVMIFESPGSMCRSADDPCTDSVLIEWTGDPAQHLEYVNVNKFDRGIYIYAPYIALHEFGHTLGLPDFYAASGDNWDARLQHVTAIMNVPWLAGDIRQGQDIAQLDAIYARHGGHDLR
jgi:hypothetical protein